MPANTARAATPMRAAKSLQRQGHTGTLGHNPAPSAQNRRLSKRGAPCRGIPGPSMDIDACLQSLQSRYEILAEIGQGGMGRVYRARDNQLDRLVAIKIPLPPDEDREKWHQVVTRFRREGRTLAKLSDPGIMSVYDLGEAEGFPYIVSEWIDGMPVHRRPKPWAATDIQIVATVLSGALAHAHTAGVIHRDIKPSNILLRSDGSPVLIDFGIARFTDDSTLTKTGSVLGTLVYLAPELLMGRELGPPVDQYALGCVLYEMAAGRTWIQAQTLAEIVQALLHKTPTPILELRPDFDPAIAALIHQMIKKTPEERFETMTHALEAWAELNPEDSPLSRVTGPTNLNRLRQLSPAALDPEDTPTEASGSQAIGDAIKAAEDTASYLGNSPPSVVLRQSASQPRVLSPSGRGPRLTPAPGHPAAALSPYQEAAVEPPNTAAIQLTLGRRRRWLILLGLFVVLLGVAWRFGPEAWSLYAGGNSVDNAREEVAGSLGDGVGDMTANLLGGPDKSAKILAGEGHMAFAEGRPRDGVKAYEEALKKSPNMANDPALVANLIEAAAAGSTMASTLLITHANERIRDGLLERSVGPGYRARHRSIDVLESLDSEDEVDWGKVGTLDLVEAPECVQRKNAIAMIELAGDKRAIPQLRRIRRSSGRDRFRNYCLLDEAERVLNKLIAAQ